MRYEASHRVESIWTNSGIVCESPATCKGKEYEPCSKSNSDVCPEMADISKDSSEKRTCFALCYIATGLCQKEKVHKARSGTRQCWQRTAKSDASVSKIAFMLCI